MTNREILQIAMKQSALDINCNAEDFLCGHPVIVRSGVGPEARKYYKEPIACNLVSYGNNVVASVRDEYRGIVEEYIGRFEFYHCFETPNLHWLNERMQPMGQKICFMAEYYLPDVEKLRALACGYELRILEQADFRDLYKPEWGNALCADRKELDVLGIGAYDGEKLIGLAGCSADCETMWQIGVDVLPEYRRRGVAAALTSSLAVAVLERGRVPFYCSAWSNIRSVRNAVKSGFIPAWVEMTVKPGKMVDELNQGNCGDGIKEDTAVNK
ncbi:MAG: GNAT family N-acetyltransferase [Lachnospiraceae bacterium]|nr:GNAT family N-acetyltransferase [Lachnospiraceae bacterium]